MRFFTIKACLGPLVVLLLTVPRRFLCCSSSLCVCGLLHRLFRPYFFSSILLLVPQKAVLHDCGISWVVSLIFLRTYIVP